MLMKSFLRKPSALDLTSHNNCLEHIGRIKTIQTLADAKK